jgi:hypothetical protein
MAGGYSRLLGDVTKRRRIPGVRLQGQVRIHRLQEIGSFIKQFLEHNRETDNRDA